MLSISDASKSFFYQTLSTCRPSKWSQKEPSSLVMDLLLVFTNRSFPGYMVSHLLISFKMPWTAFPSWVTSARQLGGFVCINYIVSLKTQHHIPLIASVTFPNRTLAFLMCLDSYTVSHNRPLLVLLLGTPFSSIHILPLYLFRSLLKRYLLTQLSQQLFGTNHPGCPSLAYVIACFSLHFILLANGVFTGIFNYRLICL